MSALCLRVATAMWCAPCAHCAPAVPATTAWRARAGDGSVLVSPEEVASAWRAKFLAEFAGRGEVMSWEAYVRGVPDHLRSVDDQWRDVAAQRLHEPALARDPRDLTEVDWQQALAAFWARVTKWYPKTCVWHCAGLGITNAGTFNCALGWSNPG